MPHVGCGKWLTFIWYRKTSRKSGVLERASEQVTRARLPATRSLVSGYVGNKLKAERDHPDLLSVFLSCHVLVYPTAVGQSARSHEHGAT